MEGAYSYKITCAIAALFISKACRESFAFSIGDEAGIIVCSFYIALAIACA